MITFVNSPSNLMVWVTQAGATLALYCILLTTYRLYFHPLSKFPGPKLAAASYWHEFYHDIWNRGQLSFEIERLHKKYGPIIRLNPNGIHINDPAFYDEIYSPSTRKRNKDIRWLQNVPGSTSVFGTADHDLHRLRRKALDSFFSTRSINHLEPINKKVQQLLSRFERHVHTNTPVRLDAAFTALTIDVIT